MKYPENSQHVGGLKIPVSPVRSGLWAPANPEIPAEQNRVVGGVLPHCAELQSSNRPNFIWPWTEHRQLVALLDERGLSPEMAIGDAVAGRTRVYFVRAAGVGLVKIGQTTQLAHRMRDLQHTSPVPLALLVAVRAHEIVEYVLHEYFAEHRRHGEWFRSAPEITDLVERLTLCGHGPTDGPQLPALEEP
jgi:hypothetical protein